MMRGLDSESLVIDQASDTDLYVYDVGIGSGSLTLRIGMVVDAVSKLVHCFGRGHDFMAVS
jgi:tRNA A58 N-methylase Trm61